ncbi:Scr1 family TA system antitoxin-like transcriptional regulator [Streptomyces phaeoluteigriseus]|uniref:Scr1 family TA system antitoxin-like transcriptional regulator n=1 Tax=Streptomyces phaeoluteigriseus TaxID=114686 RepID=UPI0036CCD887
MDDTASGKLQIHSVEEKDPKGATCIVRCVGGGVRAGQRFEELQRILEGDAPTAYVGMLHEAAARMQFGGRKMARAQVEHLLTASERPTVRLLVIPFSAGTFPGSGQTFNHLEGPAPQLPATRSGP